MKILTGICEILESPSGLFALLCLVAVVLTTWHFPYMGSTMMISFISIIVPVLAVLEHLEERISMTKNDKDK